jgi:hypothetical protein
MPNLICIAFREAVSDSDNMASNILMIVNNELENMFKEAVASIFNLPIIPEENREETQSKWSLFWPRFEPGLPEYNSESLSI